MREVFKPSWKNFTVFIVLGIFFIQNVFGLILLALAVYYRNRKKYLIETNRVASKRVLFSTKVSSINIPDIESVKLKRDMLQKFFGTGNVEIISKNGDFVTFDGISKPDRIIEKVEELINQ